MLLLYFIFIHLLLLIPGYALIKNLKILAGKPALELCAAYVVSILGLGGIAMAGYILAIPRFWLHSLPWVLVSFGTYFFIKQRLWRDLRQFRLPLLALVAMSAFSIAFVSLQLSGPRPFFPDPQYQVANNYQTFNVKVLNVAHTPANDNYVPYRQAQFMINRSDPAKDSFIDEWGVHFFQRTPLMGATTAGVFNLLGDTPPVAYSWSPGVTDPGNTYLKFQVLAQILNSLLVLPAFFLLSRLFNRKAALATLLFIIPSTFFLYNSFFSWPKSLVAFFILFSWMLLFERRLRYIVLAGVVSGAAYLAHDLAILYVAASGLLLLYWRQIRDLFVFAAIHLLFFVPWIVTSGFIYKKPSTFPLYPFSLHGIPQAGQGREIISEYFHTSPIHLIWLKIQFFWYLISPYQFFTSEGGQPTAVRLWAGTIFNVPGSVGFGLMVASLFGAIKRIRFTEFWILALVPIIMCVLFIGWPKGLGSLHFAQASVVLFMGLGAWFLAGLPHKWRWLGLAAFAINIAQVVFFGLYSYYYRAGTWMTSWHDIASLLIQIGIITGCGVALYALMYDKTGPLKQKLQAIKRSLQQHISTR